MRLTAVGWSVGQDTIELAARLDAELGEHFAQVVLDGARADEQADADLRIGQAVAGHPRDLGLLRRELLIAGGDVRLRAVSPVACSSRLARSAKASIPIASEHVVGDAKLCARVDTAALPAQPFAV